MYFAACIAGSYDSRKFVDERQEMSRRSGVVHTNLSRRSGVVHTRGVLQGFKCAGNVAFNLSRVGVGGGHFCFILASFLQQVGKPIEFCRLHAVPRAASVYSVSS